MAEGAEDPRFLELVGACNARDLGGLPTVDGGVTRSGRLLRSDFVVELGEADRQALISELGLRTVIDVRTPAEVEAFPGPWREAGVETFHIPFPLDPSFVAHTSEDLVDFYLSFLEPPASAAALALKVLLDVDAQPTLIHCTAGKDRTGVLVALALDLLRVPADRIVADYALSSSRMPLVLERLALEINHREGRILPEAMLRADAVTMAMFLERLRERYGGADGWAREEGIADETIERFRATLIDRLAGA